MRPSSSSSPQSPQVEPGGRCVHRFVIVLLLPAAVARSAGACIEMYRPVGLSCERRFAQSAKMCSGLDEGYRVQRREVATVTQKDFVVSADGHLLEPTDLFLTRLPKHLRERGVWEEDFEIEPLVEGGARIFRRLHTPGFEGWTISRYRQTGGRMPEGDPEQILDDMDLDGVDVQVMHPEPVVVRALLRRPRALHGARPRVQRLRHRAVHAVLLAAGSDRSRAPHRHRRCRRRDRAGRRRRIPRHPAPGGATEAVLLAGLRPGVGGGPGQRRARVHPHPDRRREGQRPGLDDAQGRHGVGRAGQPADDGEVGRRSG